MQKKAAILPSGGLGDALLMCIAAHQLKAKGYLPHIFHNKFSGLQSWFPDYTILPYEDKDWKEKLKEFDLILLQVEGSLKSHAIKKERQEGNLSTLHCLYPNYIEKNDGKIYENDILFPRHVPMADCIQMSMEKILQDKTSKETGILIPKGLVWKKNKSQVLLCPSSGSSSKNWEKSRFIRLAQKLAKKGYYPIFCVAPEERNEYLDIEKKGFFLPKLAKISDFASLVYESCFVIGNDSFPCHLASCLEIPQIVISSCRNHMAVWRPGWKKGICLFPPKLLPNCKFLRLKKLHWQKFISPRKVFKAFQKELKKN